MELNNELMLPVIPSDESIYETCIIAQDYIRELEEAVIVGGFLPEIYSFDPDLVNQSPTLYPRRKSIRPQLVCLWKQLKTLSSGEMVKMAMLLCIMLRPCY